jgi:hypothetical protein
MTQPDHPITARESVTAIQYIRHFNFFIGYLASDGGSNAWDASNLWYEDTVWAVAAPWS